MVDEQGKKTAVVIDLKKHRELWEDFYDSALAHARRDEPREALTNPSKVGGGGARFVDAPSSKLRATLNCEG